MNKRVTLLDPILKNKDLINLTPEINIIETFKNKFSFINFSFNILIPLIVIIILLFIAKYTYQSRHFDSLQKELGINIKKEQHHENY